jgi:hypothetical protein
MTTIDGRTGDLAMSTKATAIIAILAGTAGGIARYLDDVSEHGKTFARSVLLSKIITAGFLGWLVSELATAAQWGDWARGLAGVAGWLGPQSLDLAIDIVRQRIAPKSQIGRAE